MHYILLDPKYIILSLEVYVKGWEKFMLTNNLKNMQQRY